MRIPIQSLFTLLTHIELGLPTFRGQFHFYVNVHCFVYRLRPPAVILCSCMNKFSSTEPVKRVNDPLPSRVDSQLCCRRLHVGNAMEVVQIRDTNSLALQWIQ